MIVETVNKLAAKHSGFPLSKINKGTALWRKSKNFINSCAFGNKQFREFILDLQAEFRISLIEGGLVRTKWNSIYDTRVCMDLVYTMIETEVKSQNRDLFEKVEDKNTYVGSKDGKTYGKGPKNSKSLYQRYAADYLGISKSTLYRLTRDKIIKAGNFGKGGRTTYSIQELNRYKKAIKTYSNQLDLLEDVKQVHDVKENLPVSRVNYEEVATKTKTPPTTSEARYSVYVYVDGKYTGVLSGLSTIDMNKNAKASWHEDWFKKFFDLDTGLIEGKCEFLDKFIVNCERDKKVLELRVVKTYTENHIFTYDLPEEEKPVVITQDAAAALYDKIEKSLTPQETTMLVELIKKGGVI